MTGQSGIEGEAGFLASTNIQAEIRAGASAEIQVSRSGQAIASDDNRITHVGFDVTLGAKEPFDLTSSSFLKVRRLHTAKLYRSKAASHGIS
jgi:hypothetical protein